MQCVPSVQVTVSGQPLGQLISIANRNTMSQSDERASPNRQQLHTVSFSFYFSTNREKLHKSLQYHWTALFVPLLLAHYATIQSHEKPFFFFFLRSGQHWLNTTSSHSL